MHITILGLGIIGARAATYLAANPNYQITTWNRTPKGTPNEQPDLATAVRDAEVVLLYLKDAPAVREVSSQVFQHAAKSPTLINHSTVDLATTQWLDESCRTHGWDFLDAPFTGSRDAAANAQLVYYVSGPSTVIESMRPVLEHSSKLILPCGDVGQATILKLITNLITACSVEAFAEAFAIGRQHQLPADAIIRAVEANACASPLAKMKLPAIANGDFQPHFSLSNMLKDSQYALQLAETLDTPAIRAVSARMQEMCDAGHGDLDFSALAKAYPDHE